MHRFAARFFAGFAAVAFAPFVLADTVTLENGDRLTGKIVRLEHGKLVISTSYAGDVRINLGQVRHMQSDGTLTVVLENDERVFGRVSGDGTEITIQPDQGPAKQEPTGKVSDIYAGMVTGREWRHTGHINVGISDTSGNTDVSRYHLDAEMVSQQARNRYTAGTVLNRGTDEGQRSESNALAYLKYDRFWSRKWYGYANTTFEHDRFKDIRLRSTFGVGSGFQAIASSRTNLSLEGGLEYVYINSYVEPNDDFPAVRLAYRFDHYLLPERLQFFHRAEGYANLEEAGDSFARIQTGLRFPLRKDLVGTAQYNIDWDGDPDAGRKSVDKTFLFTLGYRW